MTTYAILLPGMEDHWATISPEERARVYAEHGRFSETLGAGGHQVVGGAQLTHSREAKTVRPGGDGPIVTDGPYTETAEHLTGFYLVESDDLDGLLDTCGILASVGHTVEVRACVGAGEDG